MKFQVNCDGGHEHLVDGDAIEAFVANALEVEPLPHCMLRAIVSDWLWSARRLQEELHKLSLEEAQA